MSKELRLFTSESVSEGHPDKVCDQISDAVLDAILEPRIAESRRRLRDHGFAWLRRSLAGEITTKAYASTSRKRRAR